MDQKTIDTIVKSVSESNVKTLSDFMEKEILPKVDEHSAKTARQIVDRMLAERYVRGRDISGLDDEQKKGFAEQVQSVFRGFREGALKVKANEALIEEQDNRGGYLVEPEVASAILRIAASVGTIMRQCQQWPMRTDELGIPNYTGSFLTGSYVGVDLPGTVTGLTFGQAVLIARKWQLAFTVGNDLLADASVQLADWLLAMAGEALANMIDQQGFIGGTVTTAPGPFVGILNLTGTNSYPNPADVGACQINTTFWLKTAKKLGLNIYTLLGNVKMAKYIYSLQGIDAWKWSKSCWAPK